MTLTYIKPAHDAYFHVALFAEFPCYCMGSCSNAASCVVSLALHGAIFRTD